MTHGSQTAAAAGAQTASEVLEFAAERGVEMVDLKFVDLPGTWQHMTLPLAALDVGDFESGLGFDGSSIRGFQEIHESDMLLIPDPTTGFIDPVLHAHDPVAHLLGRRPGDRRAVLDGTRGSSPRRPSATSPRAGSRTSPTSDPRPSSSCSTTSPTSRSSTGRSTRSTPPRASGTPAARPAPAPTSPTSSVRRRATSRSRRRIRSPTSAARWWPRWRRSASGASFTTTRSRPAARARSTCASSRCSRWPTR